MLSCRIVLDCELYLYAKNKIAAKIKFAHAIYVIPKFLFAIKSEPISPKIIIGTVAIIRCVNNCLLWVS